MQPRMQPAHNGAMSRHTTEHIANAAAALVVDEGMEYSAAKRKAARSLGSRPELPSNEQVEDAVREHIALFCADSQPAELRALRELALVWMDRLQAFRPHLSGAAWRGTATQLSALHIDLYGDDPKAVEIMLINAGVNYDAAELPGNSREPSTVLTLASRSKLLPDPVTVHLLLHPANDERGALQPDAHGRSWRGGPAALRRLLEAAPEGSAP